MKRKPSPPKPGKGRKVLTQAQRDAKQKIYAERSRARAAGLPLPPLPSQEAQAA